MHGADSDRAETYTTGPSWASAACQTTPVLNGPSRRLATAAVQVYGCGRMLGLVAVRYVANTLSDKTTTYRLKKYPTTRKPEEIKSSITPTPQSPSEPPTASSAEDG